MRVLVTVKKHLTPPMVVALAALLVALSGSAYAINQLPKNSVGTKQLRPGSVKAPILGADVKRQLRKVGKTGATGPRGFQGVTGPAGLTGATGPRGHPGLIPWNEVYEVQETSNTPNISVACDDDDRIISATWFATGGGNITPIQSGWGNGGRSFGYGFTWQSAPTSITVTGLCSPFDATAHLTD